VASPLHLAEAPRTSRWSCKGRRPRSRWASWRLVHRWGWPMTCGFT